MCTYKDGARTCHFGCDQVVFGRCPASHCLKGALHRRLRHDTAGTFTIYRPDRRVHLTLVSEAHLVTRDTIFGKARVR